MASILKLDTLQTPSGTGVITSPNKIVYPGALLQLVQAIDATSTQITTSSTTPVSSGLVLNITPTQATSKIYLTFTSFGMYQAAGQRLIGYIYRNGVNASPNNRGLFEVESSSTLTAIPLIGQMLDSPNTISTITYNVYFKSANGGTVYLLNNPPEYGNIQLTAMEIAQ